MGELLLIAGHDPTRHAGGAESYVVAQALAAQLAGYEPLVFALGPRTETVRLGFGTLHRVATPIPATTSTWAACHRPFLLRRLLDVARERPGPHIVHGHAGWSAIAGEACSRLTAAGVTASSVGSFYMTIDDEQTAKYESTLVQGSRRRRLIYGLRVAWVRSVSVPFERGGYHACDVVTVNYEAIREQLADAYGPRANVERVAYAAPAAFGRDQLSAEVAADRRTEATPPLIVSVSRHSPRKGLDVLIHALARLRDRGIAFRACLAGRGHLLEEHRALVRALGLGEQVSLPGVVFDVMPYLRECTVFVLPSTQEGSGSVSVLEALQAGAPIVASAVDGIPEDLTNDRDALLVTPGAVDELSDALARVLGDEALRRRLAAAGRSLYERRFTAAAAAADAGRLYRSLGLVSG